MVEVVDKLVELGRCSKCHGIKGELCVFLDNPDESIIRKDLKIYLFPKNSSSTLRKEGEVFKVSSVRFGVKTILKLYEVQDRNKAEEIVPFILKVNRKDFPKLGEGEFYLNDLIGVDVIDTYSKRKVAVVDSLYSNGAQTILVFRLNNELIELPLVDKFFPVIDVENRLIEVSLPEFVSER